MPKTENQLPYFDWRIFDGHNAGHDINDPLWIDDDAIPEKLGVKVLNSAKIIKKLHRSLDLQMRSHQKITFWRQTLIHIIKH